jgi:osmotically-inducible protein OsmY
VVNAITSVTKAHSKKFNLKEFNMQKRLCLFTVTLITGLMLTSFSVYAAPATVNSPLENTERNVRDSGNATLTPEDQKESRGDRKITAAIRKAVVKNKSLSLDAHNAKIITLDSVVTLRGPVENSAEKIKLQTIAEKIKGVKQVDNQLETKTP